MFRTIVRFVTDTGSKSILMHVKWSWSNPKHEHNIWIGHNGMHTIGIIANTGMIDSGDYENTGAILANIIHTIWDDFKPNGSRLV